MSDRNRLTKRKKNRESRRDKSADPYQMNVEREDKDVSDYMIGDPSSFADIPHEEMPADDELGRNEIGLPRMPDWAYDHKDADDWNSEEPYDNAESFSPTDRNREHDQGDLEQVLNASADEAVNWYEARKKKEAEKETINRLEKKAYHCVRIAENLLGEDADNSKIEEQAYDLMPLPNQAIASTLQRIESFLEEGEKDTEEMMEEMESEEEEKEDHEELEEEKDHMEKEKEHKEDEEEEDHMESEQKEEAEEEMKMEEEKEAEEIIDEVLQESGSEKADQVVDEMTGESSAGNEMEVKLEPSMEATNPEQQLDEEGQKLQEILNEDLPEEAKQARANQPGETPSDEGISTLGGSVKQSSNDDDAEVLEKLGEQPDDVSGSF